MIRGVRVIGLALLLGLAETASARLAPETTPPPCDSTTPCPYYSGHTLEEMYYEVYVENKWSFVYQSVPSNQCGSASKGCAHTWNVKSQSRALGREIAHEGAELDGNATAGIGTAFHRAAISAD